MTPCVVVSPAAIAELGFVRPRTHQSNTERMKTNLLLLATILAFGHDGIACADDAATVEESLIVPGVWIGCLALGGPNNFDKLIDKELGDPNSSDSAMGGHHSSVWILGTPPDEGKDFPATYEIGSAGQKENRPGAVDITSLVWTTSSAYRTAEGIGPGSTLEQIRQQYPDLHLDDEMYGDAAPKESNFRVWPLYGEMDFFVSKAQGIAFAIQKKEGICIEVIIQQKQKDDRPQPYQIPMAAADHSVTPKTHRP